MYAIGGGGGLLTRDENGVENFRFLEGKMKTKRKYEKENGNFQN